MSPVLDQRPFYLTWAVRAGPQHEAGQTGQWLQPERMLPGRPKLLTGMLANEVLTLMKGGLYGLAGALVNLGGAWAMGHLLLLALRLRLPRMERRLFALVAGGAWWSAAAYLLARIHFASRGSFVALAAVAMLAAALVRAKHTTAESSPEPGGGLRWLLRALLACYSLLYLVYALNPDSTVIHTPTRMTGQLRPARPSAVEFLYLPAFSLGRQTGVALSSVALLLALALGLTSYARWRGRTSAGVLAAALVFASPMAAAAALTASPEPALACALFYCFYALELYRATRQRPLLSLAALLLVFSFTIGVSAKAAPPADQPQLPAYLFGKAGELTVRGAARQGLLGPVFLLAPLGLLALRQSTGRRVLRAGALAALWLAANPGPEAALPAASFTALAMGLALENSTGMVPLLAVAHAVLSLPPVTGAYCWCEAWRLRDWPIERPNTQTSLTPRTISRGASFSSWRLDAGKPLESSLRQSGMGDA